MYFYDEEEESDEANNEPAGRTLPLSMAALLFWPKKQCDEGEIQIIILIF